MSNNSNDLYGQLCLTFDSMNTTNNIVRKQAEDYLGQVRENLFI